MADEPQPQVNQEQEAALAGGASGRLISDADEDTAAWQPEVVAGPAGTTTCSSSLALLTPGSPEAPGAAAAVPAPAQPNANGNNGKDDADTAGNSSDPQQGDASPSFNGPSLALGAAGAIQQPTSNHAETPLHHRNSMVFPQFPPPYPPPLHYPLGTNSDMIRYYEAQMRDHAAAYANAAAGAAWAAAQWASQAADFYSIAPQQHLPAAFFAPPQPPAGLQQIMMAQPPPYPPLPTNQGPLYYPPTQMQFQQQQQQRLPMMQEDQAFDPQPYSDSHTNFSNHDAENRTDQLHQDDENHRRKRQHRFRGNNGNRILDDNNNNPNDYHHNEEDFPHEITPHQRSDSHNHHRAHHHHHHSSSGSQYAPQRGRSRRRLRSDNDSSSSGSSFPNNSNILRSSRSRHHHHPSKKKKARSDESLIGKTAVSALYEYCGRRQCFPTVTTQQLQVDEFECIVHLNSFGAPPGQEPNELGRGRGSNKNAAKQEAARRALQQLLPGVLFDSATLVSALPVESSTTEVAATAPPPDQRPNTKSKQQQQRDSGGGGGGSSSCVMMDDLAPHLAKQLAIDSSKTSNKRLNSNSSKANNNTIPKRSLGGYPSTTTSEGDDPDGDYYSSRGASVCSQLLYTIVQIDRARIVEPPQFTYQVTGSANSNEVESPARRGSAVPSSTSSSSIFGPRGFSSLTCTGRLKVLSTTVARRHERNPNSMSGNKDEDDAVDPAERRKDDDPDDETTEEILEAVAVGSTKREARHVAAAKLLALLFPECGSDMAKVKAAAEAVRERYAAQKALKQQQSQQGVGDSYRTRQEEKWSLSRGHETDPDLAEEGLDFAKAQESDPWLPEPLAEALQALLQRTEWRTNNREQAAAAAQDAAEEDLLVSSVSAVDLSDNKNHSPCTDSRQAPVHHQLNRQKQLDALVETALQNLNDRDEEGRTLPEELTENDVGRTMLRRAQPEDLPHIRKLLFQSISGIENRGTRFPRSRSFDAYSSKMPAVEHCMTPPAHHHSFLSPSDSDDLPHATPSAVEREHVSSSSELLTRLRSLSSSSSSVVLLLCRAIAPHDEDPLGCAVLTIGFSMKHGRSLCVGTMATEPHLPRERFLECLQDFATCMRCHFQKHGESDPNVLLVDDKASQSRICLSAADLVTIVESHVAADEKPRATGDPSEVRTKRSVLASSASGNSLSMSAQLPTLLEEQPSEDDASSVEKRMAGQPSRQPSKRSRVS